MPSTYKTPGVYTEEISIFPPSVAAVDTAIPAFIGYTEKAEKNGEDLYPVFSGSTVTKPAIPVVIRSMLEYEQYFGGAHKPSTITVDLDGSNNIQKISGTPEFYLFYSLRLYFANGGGKCYIVPIASYENASKTTIEFSAGLSATKKEDEPTILLFPDAILLPTVADLGQVQKAALAQCELLKDRFGVFDVKNADQFADINAESSAFRDNIGMNDLKYGAAYYPYLHSSQYFDFSYENIIIKKSGVITSLAALSTDTTAIDNLESAINDFNGDGASPVNGIVELNAAIFGGGSETYTQWYEDNSLFTTPIVQMQRWVEVVKTIGLDIVNLRTAAGQLSNPNVSTLIDTATDPGSDFNQILQSLLEYDLGYGNIGSALGKISDSEFNSVAGLPTNYLDGSSLFDAIYGTGNPTDHRNNSAQAFRSIFEKMLSIIEGLILGTNDIIENLELTLRDVNPLYSKIVAGIEGNGMVLPPSGAIAGIYASVDRTRGVWKAPANVSLSNVIKPLVKISNEDQDGLNVDTNAGKSINAIRSFTGKGTLVWGARTLAGNSNEWRYVPVRRFFNMVEESVQKATSQFVFEANDANTWIKVKAMIENFLILQWRAGALAGATPEQAFFVKVGLGETMTAVQIQEGYLIVEIGMAVVRPAEFIILKFSHKLQES